MAKRRHPLVRRAPGDYLLLADDGSLMLRIRRFKYEPFGAYVWWVTYKAIPAQLRDTPWDLCPPEWLTEWLRDGWTVHGEPTMTRREALEGARDLIAGRHLHAVPDPNPESQEDHPCPTESR